jgi:hypothetical protein
MRSSINPKNESTRAALSAINQQLNENQKNLRKFVNQTTSSAILNETVDQSQEKVIHHVYLPEQQFINCNLDLISTNNSEKCLTTHIIRSETCLTAGAKFSIQDIPYDLQFSAEDKLADISFTQILPSPITGLTFSCHTLDAFDFRHQSSLEFLTCLFKSIQNKIHTSELALVKWLMQPFNVLIKNLTSEIKTLKLERLEIPVGRWNAEQIQYFIECLKQPHVKVHSLVLEKNQLDQMSPELMKMFFSGLINNTSVANFKLSHNNLSDTQLALLAIIFKQDEKVNFLKTCKEKSIPYTHFFHHAIGQSSALSLTKEIFEFAFPSFKI